MMYAVVVGTPGISVNTTLPRDAKEGCSEFDLGVAAFELSQEEFQPDQRWGLKLSQVFRVSYEARIFVRSSPARRSMRKQVDTGCSRSNPGKPSKHAWRSHGAAVARSHVIPQAEMPAIDPWWACRQGPCAAPRAIARSGLSGKLTRAAGGWKGTRAGLATRPGLRDDSPWRTWQPYRARGRCRLSGAAAGPHCRATRPRAPPSTA